MNDLKAMCELLCKLLHLQHLLHQQQVLFTDPNESVQLCGSSLYCYLPWGVCAGIGECSMYDELCQPDYFDPVCGCNGTTYTNPCFAGMNGANVRYEAACSP